MDLLQQVDDQILKDIGCLSFDRQEDRGLGLGVQRSVRSRDEQSAWLQAIRRNLTPRFTRMRFCFAIGRSRKSRRRAGRRFRGSTAQFVLPGDKPMLEDMRSSATLRRSHCGGDFAPVAAKTVNSARPFESSARREAAAVVPRVDEAGSKGRRKMRRRQTHRLERYRMGGHFQDKVAIRPAPPGLQLLGRSSEAEDLISLATPPGFRTRDLQP
jgi:hypothetical protein